MRRQKTLYEQLEAALTEKRWPWNMWEFRIMDEGVMLLDAYYLVPTEKEIRDLFAEILVFYEWVYEEFGSVNALNDWFTLIKEDWEKRDMIKVIEKTRETQRVIGNIYVLKTQDVYKIGKAKIVDKRVEQISPVMPYPVRIVFSHESPFYDELECALHEQYKEKRLNGEWFKLLEKDLDDIKNYCIEFDMINRH